MQNLFLYFVAFWMALLPVYLWGYVVTMMLDDRWNRMRFFIGLMLGSIGVGLTYIFASSFGVDRLFEIGILLGFFVFLFVLIFGLTFLGSRFSRVFLQKIALTHIIVLAVSFILLYTLSLYIPLTSTLAPLVVLFFITPFLEEAAKHLGTLGLIGQDFRFSEKDMMAFTLFVVLGFVFAENLIYLIDGRFSLGTWIWRSFFTLTAHIFTALICAHYWWRALSYPLFSWRYIATFFGGFVLAGGLHTLYNSLLSAGSILGLIIFAIVGYVLVVVRKN